jgi:hypothetical protein
MTTRIAKTQVIQDALSKVNALRRVSRETGMITRRAQSKVLEALTDEEATAVAEILALQPEITHE